MILRKLSWVLVLFFLIEAIAQELTNKEIRVEGIAFRYFADQVLHTNSLATWIRSIKPYFKSFELPTNVVIKVRDDLGGQREGVDNTGHMLYDSARLTFSGDVEPVLAHEYAHLVFSHLGNLSTVVSEDNEYLQYIRKQIELRDQMEKADPNDKEAQVDLMKEARFLEFLYEENDLQNLSRPYNEFFADLVAAMAMKDPAAMAKVEKSSTRSFEPGGQPSQDYLEQIDPHLYFFTARQLVWRRYVKMGMSLSSAQTILRIVYDIAWKEINERAAASELRFLSKSEVDQRFLDALSDALSKHDGVQ